MRCLKLMMPAVLAIAAMFCLLPVVYGSQASLTKAASTAEAGLARALAAGSDDLVPKRSLAGASIGGIYPVLDAATLEVVCNLATVRGSDGAVTGLIGVDRSQGRVLWYSFNYGRRVFPPVAAGEARAKAAARARAIGEDEALGEPVLVRGCDERLYWRFETPNGEAAFVDADGAGVEAVGTSDGSAREIVAPAPTDRIGAALGAAEPGLDAAEWAMRTAARSFPEARPEGGLDTRPPAYNMPGIPYHYQITDYNCGPAALQMTMDYCSEEISQSAIADVANTFEPGGTYADDLLRAAHFSGMSAAVQDPLLRGYADRKLGYSAESYYWGYSPSEERAGDLKTLAYAGYPVLILTWFDAGHGSGHFRVVKGYDDNLGVFVVHDPWYYGFSGPDLLVDQAYLVDDLWAYSWWWGMISGPWVLRSEVPSSVAVGDTFEVDLKIRYPGPYPFASSYPCSGCKATVSLPSGLALAGGSSTVNLANMDSGDSAVVTWDVVAVGPVGEQGISFQAQGTVTGSCGSYPSYSDTVGGHSYETVKITSGLLAEWLAEERLTTGAGGSQTAWPGSRAMVMDDDGDVHLVWADTRDGNSEIYYRKRSAGAWGTEVRLTNDPEFSDGPCIARGPDGRLHVAWVDARAGNQEIYYKYYDPAGGWSADERVTTYSEGDHNPTIAADAAAVYLAWQERETGGGLHYYYVMFSTRTIAGWSTPVDVDASPERDSYRPSLACGTDGRVHLVYERQTANAPNEKERIVYRYWNGSAWSARTGLSTELSYSRGPVIAAGAGGKLHVVWQDGENVGGDIFYVAYDGVAWQAVEEIVTGGADAATPSVAADGSGTVYVAWADGRHGEPEIYLMTKQGGAWSDQGRISRGAGESMLPAVAANVYGDPCVVWTDLRHGSSDLYFRTTSDVSGVLPVAGLTDGSIFGLGLPYPTPSASGATVPLAVRKTSALAVEVFDVKGAWVRTLAGGAYLPGLYSIEWRGDDQRGSPVAAGVYFIRCRGGAGSNTRTVVIVR